MAKIKTHCEDTLIVLQQGYDFIEVHEWLDYWAKKWPPPVYLEYHRAFRHNAWGIEQIKEKWGWEGELAGKLHLIRDVELYVLHGTGYHFVTDIHHDRIDELYEKALRFLPPRKIERNENESK